MRVLAVAVAALLLITGCGSSDEGTPPASTPAAVSTSATAQPPASTPIDGHTVMSVAQVVDAFQQAKLPVRNPRDNSDNCEAQQLGCIQLTTTDDISVTSFATVDEAKAYAAVSGSESYSSGNIVLGYAAARTPAALRPRYQKILEGLK